LKALKGASMKANLVAVGAALVATLASASWAQASGDLGTKPSQAAVPMTHLAIGTVRNIDAAGRGVTIDHQAIPSLGMPAMTMQVQLSPSSKLGLEPGQSIAFTFTASADGLTIATAQPIQAAGRNVGEGASAASSMPNMDHSGMTGMTDSCQELTQAER
jgi:Cu/Ag efflux protein CusF